MIELTPGSAASCAPIMWENAHQYREVPSWMTVESLERGISPWTFINLCIEQEIIGIISLNKNRFHLDIVKKWQGRWCFQDIIRRGLDVAFESNECLETSIEKNNTRAIRLAERAGFKKIGESEGYTQYRMNRHERRL